MSKPMPHESASAPAARHMGLAAVCVLLVVLTLPVDQLYSVHLPGGIDVSLQTVALLASAIAILLSLLRRPVVPASVLVVLAPLVIWVWFETVRSVDVPRATTYLLLLALCGLLYFELSRRDPRQFLGRVNRIIFWVGSTLTLTLFARYIYILTHGAATILANPYLWDVGSADVYEVQYGGVIAFQGFGGDPNSVGVGTAIILFCGMNVRFRSWDWLRHCVNVLLVATILASNSRGAVAALLISFGVGILLRAKDHKRYFAVLVTIGATLWAIVMRNADWLTGLSNPLEKLQRGSTKRFQEWVQVADSFADHPVIGSGARFSEALLGKYTENSYLTLLADTGLVGLFAYVLAVGLAPVLFVASRRHRRADMQDVMPWFVYAVFIFASMIYVSMEVKPIVWVTAGILMAAVLARGDGAGRREPRSQGVTAAT